MPSPNAITLKRVTKIYRGRPVLNDLSFEFARGEFCQVVGKNGSGKSTLLRALSGVTPLSRGSIAYARDLRRARIGYVPQRGGHYPDLTLRENALLISSVISPRGHSLLDRKDLLDGFEMANLLDRQLRTFSEGMRRIATFLAVWSARPQILFADEPIAGVDPANAQRLIELLLGNDIGTELRVVTSHEPFARGDHVLDLSGSKAP